MEIPADPLDRAYGLEWKIAFAAVVTDGRSHVEDGNVLAPSDELLYLAVIDIGRAAAAALDKLGVT